MSDIPRLNIDDLYEKKKEVDTNRVNLYNKLLVKVHNRIKTCSRQRFDNEFCYFVMPEILVGYPNYNFNECLMYILSCLDDDGFITKYVHPNLILISWRHWIPQHVREEIKKKTGKSVDKFGKESSTTNSAEKKVHFEATKKETKINNSYKPSGKFIYGNDVLSTIKDIL
jgi:hypothetical protein